MHNTNVDTSRTSSKRGWRVNEWHPAVGVSRSQTYKLIAEGRIETVTMGAARIILTSPAEFLASLRKAA